MSARPLLAALFFCAVVVACSAAGRPTRPAAADRAHILVHSDVADAELWVDDRFIAHAGNLTAGVSVRPGAHRLELRHDQYHTHYAAITVAAGEQRTVVVELAEVLP